MYQCICVIDDWRSVDLAEVLKAMPAYSYIDVAQPSEGTVEMLEVASARIH